MKIQQHDGVVVEATVISAELRQALGEGEARGLGAQPSLPPLYIGCLGGCRPWEIQSPRGAAAKGVPCPPRQGWCPPPLGFPTLGAGGLPDHQGLVPLPLQPMGPSGIGGPTRWTPGTLPVVPVQYR